MSLRLVMMGTGTFALPTFAALYESSHDVVGLFTQPDRTGRGHHRHRNSLKDLALTHETPVFQPAKVNDPEAIDSLHNLKADLCVVAAYGQILSRKLLETPRLGAINIHASLLPKYRGAAPIHYAVLNGETETGVTIFQIEPKLDTGPVLAVEASPIGPKETTGEVEERLSQLSGPLTLEVLNGLETGTLEPILQDTSGVTLAPTMRKSFGQIEWTKPTTTILCHLRAMQPWPTPFTFLNQPNQPPLRLIILDADPGTPEEANPETLSPGTVSFVDDERFSVSTTDGAITVRKIRPEGKREMTTADFLRGRAIQVGDVLG